MRNVSWRSSAPDFWKWLRRRSWLRLLWNWFLPSIKTCRVRASMAESSARHSNTWFRPSTPEVRNRASSPTYLCLNLTPTGACPKLPRIWNTRLLVTSFSAATWWQNLPVYWENWVIKTLKSYLYGSKKSTVSWKSTKKKKSLKSTYTSSLTRQFTGLHLISNLDTTFIRAISKMKNSKAISRRLWSGGKRHSPSLRRS